MTKEQIEKIAVNCGAEVAYAEPNKGGVIVSSSQMVPSLPCEDGRKNSMKIYIFQIIKWGDEMSRTYPHMLVHAIVNTKDDLYEVMIPNLPDITDDTDILRVVNEWVDEHLIGIENVEITSVKHFKH